MFKHQPFGYKREDDSFDLMQTFWVGLMFLAGAIIFSLNREQRYQARAIEYTGTLFNGIKAHSASLAESVSAFFGKQSVVETEKPSIETERHLQAMKTAISTRPKTITALKRLSDNQLAIAYQDDPNIGVYGVIDIFNLTTEKVDKTLKSTYRAITKLEKLDDSNYFYSIMSAPNHIARWNLETGNEEENYYEKYQPIFFGKFNNSIAFTYKNTQGNQKPSDWYYIALANQGNVKSFYYYWLKYPSNENIHFIYSLPDDYVVLGINDEFLLGKNINGTFTKLADVEQKNVLANLHSPQQPIIYKNPDICSKDILIGGCKDGKVRFWNIDNLVKGYDYNECILKKQELDCETSLPIKELHLLPNGVLITLTDEQIKFWDMTKRVCLYTRQESNAVIDVYENGEFVVGYGNGKLDFYNGNLPIQDFFVQRPAERITVEPQRLAIAM